MKALLVDGLNLVRRIFAAIPDNSAADAWHQHLYGVVDASTRSLQRALNQHHPTHCLVVFESGGRNWRHRLFPDYKKKRPPMPSELQKGIPLFEKEFSDIGVHSVALPGFEADDVIATVATKVARKGGDVLILSTDRNYCQLLDEHIRVYDHFGQRYLDEDMISKRFQVQPQQLPEMLALAGDSGLSIPGVKSVGIRTAARLINEYGTLEKVLAAADDIPGKLGARLYNGKDEARLARKLFSLRTDVDLGINLNQLRYHS